MSEGETGPAASSGVIAADQINREAPLTLQAAAERAFPDGTMTVRTLRAERDRGRLETWIIGKREYTSLAAISKMIELCRTASKARAFADDRRASPSMSSSSEVPKPQPGAALRSLQMLKERMHQGKQAKAETPSGLSSTEDANMALALARASAKRLREHSRSTSKRPGPKHSG